MPESFRQSDLEAYLDEALPAEEMASVEAAFRDEPSLAAELAAIIARRDSGLISVGEIWRRERLSCPARQELGSHLLGVLPDDAARYVTFHIEVVGCRICQANIADLQDREAEVPENADNRRRKFFQSSVGRLRQT